MKKLFTFIAAVAASMSLMAQVEFHYLPGVGDRFNTSDKVEVQAGDQFISGDNFEVFNAYKTTYKAVGMRSDTAYCHMTIGDVTVDFNDERIQGQDNPNTAAGGNPVLDMTVPAKGACYKVVAKADGWMIAVVKATPNKQYFVFTGLEESNGVLAGAMQEYYFVSMSYKAGENAPGTPAGHLSIYYQGNADGQLMAPPAMPNAVYGSGYSTNGVGAIVFQVTNGQEYLVGAAGSKIMAAGFAYSANLPEIVAVGSQNVVRTEGGEVENYDNVPLFGENVAIEKTEVCDQAPIFVRVKMPANEVANDTTNIWFKYTANYNADGTVKDYKKAANMYAWVWANGVDGQWYNMSVSGAYYVLQVGGIANFNAVFAAVNDWSAKTGDYQQTVDVLGINRDMCYQIGDVPADPNTKCDVIKLDCLTGEASGVEDVVLTPKAEKFILNGHLYIRANGVVYNALGTVVE